jgi:hypothetical protein
MRPSSLVVGLAAMLTFAPAVHGQSQADRAQAAWKMAEGKRALAKGDLDAAIAAYEAAHVVLKQPDSGAPLARSLAKKGRLADALAVARAVAQSPKPGKEAFSVASARAEAEKLFADLDKRVPKLKVEAPEGTSVTIDGRDVPSENGVRRVDPGDHKVEGKRDGKTATADVKLTEGDDKSVMLDFGGGAAAATTDNPKADGGSEPKGEGAEPAPKDVAKEPEAKGNPAAATAAIVGFTTFAAGTGLGLGAFFASQSRLDDLDEKCGGDCTGSLKREENDANAIRIFAFAGFGVAGAGLVTGIVGAAVAGSAGSSKESAHVEPLVGPGYAGLRGRF